MCFAKYFQATVPVLHLAIACCPAPACVSFHQSICPDLSISFHILQDTFEIQFVFVQIFVPQFFLFHLKAFLFLLINFFVVTIQVLLLYFLVPVPFVKIPIPCNGLPLISLHCPIRLVVIILTDSHNQHSLISLLIPVILFATFVSPHLFFYSY